MCRDLLDQISLNLPLLSQHESGLIKQLYGDGAVKVTLQRLLDVFAPRLCGKEIEDTYPNHIEHILELADQHNIPAQTIEDMLERACNEETAAMRAERSDQSSSSRGRPTERPTRK